VEVERVLGDEHSRRIKFIAAAQAASSLPLPSLPEVALAGRSNVGKSSLINALTLSAVARQSDKPGVTQSLNFYEINAQMRIIDMPGYGFAFAEAEKSQRWNELMDDYLHGRGSVLKVRTLCAQPSGAKASFDACLNMIRSACWWCWTQGTASR
jgi:GTP-binding protein